MLDQLNISGKAGTVAGALAAVDVDVIGTEGAWGDEAELVLDEGKAKTSVSLRELIMAKMAMKIIGLKGLSKYSLTLKSGH